MEKRDEINAQAKDKVYRKKHAEHREQSRRPAAGWIALFLLILAALILPQAVFRIQDNLLCGGQVLGEREEIDVSALGTSYERSLRRRMLRFAEGQAAGNRFYVTSRVLPISQEIYDILYTEGRLYQSVLAYTADIGILSNAVLREEERDIRKWKQYVIYSDDYAGGVNFILWYIELLGRSEGEVLKLLMDAEDYTIYAVKEENSIDREMWWVGDYDPDGGLTFSWYEGILLWYEFSSYFNVVTQEEIESRTTEMVNMSASAQEFEAFLKRSAGTGPDSLLDVYLAYNLFGSEFVASLGSQWQPGFREGRDNVFSFPLNYDDTAFFDVVVDMREAAEGINVITNKAYRHVYFPPDVTIGIRQIYEKIPEFSEDS